MGVPSRVDKGVKHHPKAAHDALLRMNATSRRSVFATDGYISRAVLYIYCYIYIYNAPYPSEEVQEVMYGNAAGL